MPHRPVNTPLCESSFAEAGKQKYDGVVQNDCNVTKTTSEQEEKRIKNEYNFTQKGGWAG
jgi:hypothetical protein